MINITEELRKGLPEEKLFETYFSEQFWTLEQFSALLVGLSPERLKEICDKRFLKPTQEELKKAISALRTQKLFHDDSEKDIALARYQDGIMSMSQWRFIKWTAINNPPFHSCFWYALPLYLKELFFEFQPMSMILKTKSKYCREYHEALYLVHAEKLISNSPRRLSRDEIYNDPFMKSVEDSFIGHDKTRVTYKKRTITESWLRKTENLKPGCPGKKTKST